MHLGEVATLKSSCASINITTMNLDKVIGQRPRNKSGLGYKKYSKTSNYPKLKEKQGQESNAKFFET
jgi:hypothetical protein